jgi:hypothetical protein
MNTTEVKVETTVDVETNHHEEPSLQEAIKELSSIDLAYVGGGTASVMFF